ncbi:hypothetical protein BGZ81_008763 [Podila clonocystis]|nr:hypothetical protein BGZ81_008763 [Podila clonocystis]
MEEKVSWATASKDLLSALNKHGVSKAVSLGIYDDRWQAVFEFEKAAIVDGLISSGSLEQLTVDISDPDFDNEIDLIMQLNKEFEALNIYIPGGKEVYRIGECIVRDWHMSSRSICLSIFERTKDGQGRIVAQTTIKKGRHYNKDLESSPSWIADTDFLDWSCDLVHAPLSDYSASILDCAIRHHPTVLKSFALNVSCLSQTGLACIQNILRQSELEHLHVICTSLDPDLADSIHHLLRSVSWSTLKSLELSGDDIESWVQLWMMPDNQISAPVAGSVLQSLTIHGGSHELSHAIVLFVHKLVFASPLELHLENVRLQDENDWPLIIDAVNDSFAGR